MSKKTTSMQLRPYFGTVWLVKRCSFTATQPTTAVLKCTVMDCLRKMKRTCWSEAVTQDLEVSKRSVP